MQYNSLEYRILRMSLWSALCATFFLILHDTFISFNINDILVEMVGVMIFGGLITLFTYTRHFELVRNIFLASIFILLDLGWYINQGMGIGLGLLFLSAIVYAQILIKEEFRVLLTVLYSSNITALLAYEAINPAFYRIDTYGTSTPLLTKISFIVITYTLTSWVVMYLKHQYDLGYQKNLEQEQMLKEKNDQIQAINQDLQLLVAERTNTLKENQQRLLEYAFLHSHSIRAPLSNILGIHEALRVGDLSRKERAGLIRHLENEAKRLDSEIREMQELLQQESLSRRNEEK